MMINHLNEQMSDEEKRAEGCIKVDIYFTPESFHLIANELGDDSTGIPADGWVKEEFCEVNDYLYMLVSVSSEKFVIAKII